MRKQSRKTPKRAHIIFTLTKTGYCFPPVLLVRGSKLKLAAADDSTRKSIVKTTEKSFSADPNIATANPGEIWIVPPNVSDEEVYLEYMEAVFQPHYSQLRASVDDGTEAEFFDVETEIEDEDEDKR